MSGIFSAENTRLLRELVLRKYDELAASHEALRAKLAEAERDSGQEETSSFAEGRKAERAAIVEWLFLGSSRWKEDFRRVLAEDIVRGAHMPKPPPPKTPEEELAELRAAVLAWDKSLNSDDRATGTTYPEHAAIVRDLLKLARGER